MADVIKKIKKFESPNSINYGLDSEEITQSILDSLSQMTED